MAEEWNTIVNGNSQGTEAGWSYRTVRVRIDPTVIGASLGKIRLRFNGGYGPISVPNVFVGTEKLPNTTYGGMMFDAPPKRVTFGGANGFMVFPGGVVYSDIIDIDYDVSRGRGLIVSFYAPIAYGASYVEYPFTDAVPGVATKFMNGPDYSGAMQYQIGQTPAFSWSRHYLYLLMGVEIVASDVIVPEPTGDITSAGGVFVTSTGGVFISGRLAPAVPEIGASFVFNSHINYTASVSKFSTYVIVRNNARQVSKFSTYIITSTEFTATYDFNYYISQVDTGFDFNYGIDVGRVFSFNYKILVDINKSFDFNYDIGQISSMYAFNYAIRQEINNDYTFNYQIAYIPRAITKTFEFDYGIERDKIPLLIVPEVPIRETWTYATALAKNYDGTEQRAALRDEPATINTYEYIFDDERMVLYRDLFTNVRSTFMLPIYAYAAVMTGSATAGATSLPINPATCDLRAGDDVLCLAPDESYEIGTVMNVGTDDVILTEGITAALPYGSWIVPMRETYIADDNGISMRSIAGNANIAYASVSRRTIKRPGVVAGIVPTYDGIPLLELRPLADNDVTEMFAGNAERIAEAVDVNVTSISTWKMPTVSGARSFLVDRRKDMDFWREFADTTKGRRGSFLMPTFRADLVPISSAGAVLTVSGVYFVAWAKFDAYSRLRIETSAGVVYRKVMAAVRSGNETVIALDSALPGVVERVSFLNRVRLATDTFSWQHIETQSLVTFEIVTVNE